MALPKDVTVLGSGVGVKHDTGKPEMALIPSNVLREVGIVFTKGAEKYSPDNWRDGMRHRRMASAALRHIGAYLDGEDLDEEWGLHHLAHATCCIMMLYGMILDGTGTDDRYKKKAIDTIKDGFGSEWSTTCPECKKDSMFVVRPGKCQCSNCG